MHSHYHQCPKCQHIWSCDDLICGGELRVKDRRCFYDVYDLDVLRELRDSYFYPIRGKRRSGGARKRRVG